MSTLPETSPDIEADFSTLQSLLDFYRRAAHTEREQCTYCERLAVAYMSTDPVQAAHYDGIWSYAEWAKAQGIDGRDTGVDLVASLRCKNGFRGVQSVNWITAGACAWKINSVQIPL